MYTAGANGLFEQLCAFNPNWKNYRSAVPIAAARSFENDRDYIRTHLTHVLQVLKQNSICYTNSALFSKRMTMLQLLDDYRLAGRFPINDARRERIPVFIDPNFTHCAVAYLMQQTGFEDLAFRIAQDDNFAWVKDIHTEGVLQWQQSSGLTLDELKLIQGAYDFYEPRGFELPNKYEIPQKPTCITVEFETTKNWRRANPGKQAIWCRGEGVNGVLNGRWEQNYAVDMPWIIGYYTYGKRTGQWFEYYPGTHLLCRTERWENDKLNGIRTRFDRDGNIIEEITFKDGNAITKINYDRADSIKWVREPIDSIQVNTKVYTMSGTLLALGREKIYNPGNLLWFQNIELTALNSASISARSTVTGNTGNNDLQLLNDPYLQRQGLFFSPPLVTYKKEGTWHYYQDCDPRLFKIQEKHPAKEMVFRQFRHFGLSIYQQISRYTDLKPISGIDHLKINYANDQIQDFYAFTTSEYIHLKFLYYAFDDGTIVNQYYLDPYRGLREKPSIVKTIGAYDQYNQRTGTWNYFDKMNRLFKTEYYLLPQKDEDDEMGQGPAHAKR